MIRKMKNKKNLIALFILMMTSFQLLATELYFDDYYDTDQVDCTPAVQAMLCDAQESAVEKIIFTKGIYHFYPDLAHEEFCFISNHDDGLRRILFPIKNMENLTIDGGGAEFIFHGLMIPFVISKSNNIEVENLSIDWELPLHSEAKVIAVNEEDKSFDIEISSKYPYEIRNDKLFFLKEGGYEHDLGNAIFFDAETKTVLYNTGRYGSLYVNDRKVETYNKEAITHLYDVDTHAPMFRRQHKEYSLVAQYISPGVVRLSNVRKDLPPVGSILVAKGTHGSDRNAPAFWLQESINVTFNAIDVFHTGGMGLIAELCQDIDLHQFNVKLRDNSDRYVSSTADATHFINCSGHITMDSCTYSNMLDDATNVHGMYLRVNQILDNHTIGVNVGHFQQANAPFALEGDDIGFVNAAAGFSPYSNNKLVKLEKVNSRYYKLTFKDKIEADCQKGDLIENITRNPTFSATNCVVKNNRARGFLISTPAGTTIENCYFSTMMSAILMPVEFGFWYESGRAADVTIKKNTFGDCAYGGAPFPVIFITTSNYKSGFKDMDTQPIAAFKNINILDNTFKTFSNYILGAKDVDGLQFSNNTVELSHSWPPIYPDLPGIKINNCRRIKLQNVKGLTLSIDDYSSKELHKL